MPSSDGHPEYDANLLSAAPAPTKGMVQSGYATDLLEDKPDPSKPNDLEAGRHNSLLRPNRPKSTIEGVEQPSTTLVRTKLSPSAGSTEKRPFYRTTKGIVILIIVAVVIVAAIIGGAVGGALANKKKSEPTQQALTDSNRPGEPTSGGGGDVGRIPDTSTLAGAATSVIRITTTVNPIASPTSVVRITTTVEPLNSIAR